MLQKIPCSHHFKFLTTVSLPSLWDPQPRGKIVHLVNLQASSSEYKVILNCFNKYGDSACEVTKIERIQNPSLYRAYVLKKQTISGPLNEMRLFHGTDEKNVIKINANSFSRSFAGENGKSVQKSKLIYIKRISCC